MPIAALLLLAPFGAVGLALASALVPDQARARIAAAAARGAGRVGSLTGSPGSGRVGSGSSSNSGGGRGAPWSRNDPGDAAPIGNPGLPEGGRNETPPGLPENVTLPEGPTYGLPGFVPGGPDDPAEGGTGYRGGFDPRLGRRRA